MAKRIGLNGNSQTNVAVTYIPNTFNLGSMMMAENLINSLNKLNGTLKFYTDASSDTNLIRLREATNAKNIHSLSEFGFIKNDDIAKYNKVKRRLTRILQRMRYPGMLINNNISNQIILGGDSISEYYGTAKSAENILKEFNRLARKGIALYLVGQTLGPFYSTRIALSKEMLGRSNIHIYIRDSNNFQYVKDTLKLENAMECADLAFLDLARQNDDSLSNLLEKYSLTKDNYITLVPSGLWKHYHENREGYVSAWTELVRKLLDSEETGKFKIVLMPHVLKPENVDDRNVIKDVCKNISSKNVVFINDELLPFQARHILGNGRMTITGRMHAAVSTFQMGKPAISLSYSVKYAGVIGKGLKRDDLIIEGKDEKLYSGDKMARAVLEKVKYVNDNHDRLVAEIKPEVEKQKVKAMKQIDDIARKIMGEG